MQTAMYHTYEYLGCVEPRNIGTNKVAGLSISIPWCRRGDERMWNVGIPT
jgi:hypothetical protein